MFRQMRSFTEPPGLRDSSLAQTSAPFLSARARSLTTGVEPIRSSTDRAPFMLATRFSTFLVGMKFELTFAKCYSFALVLSMKSLDQTVAQTDCSKVCVIFPGALGDFVCFLPTLQALTKSAQVVLYCHRAFAEIAPCGVTFRSIESPEISRLFVPGSGLDAAQKKYFRDYAAVYSWTGSQQPEFVTQL